MSTLGEFNLLTRDTESNLNEETNSFEFSDITNTANDWIDSLGGTFIKYTEARTAYETAKNDTKQKEYEYATQEQNKQYVQGVNNNSLIYFGVGAVALYLIFGGD